MILLSDHRGQGLTARLRPLAEAGYELVRAGSLAETRARVAAQRPALIVLDPLAVGGQVELGEVERFQDGAPPIPVLLVCDPGAPAAALEAARGLSGCAWDLVHRDAPVEEYALRIERLLDQAQHQGELDELRYRATHDDRTELLRPRFFQSRLAEHFSASQRHRLDLALVLIDLDDFGLVNKTFDHTVGDLVIGRVGEAIRRALRAEDVAGRLGGDEFGVLLPYATPIDAAHVVRRLLEEIRRATPRGADPGPALSVSGSIGFQTVCGGDLDSVETLRHHAELALRHAKRSGGDRGVYYRSLVGEAEARG